MKNLSFKELDQQLAKKIRSSRKEKEKLLLKLQLKYQLLILANEKNIEIKLND